MENQKNIQICKEMEEIINQLPDVISSKVILDEHNEIEEIHVLAYHDRSAKQISRDVQSALTARFTIKIDYKKISVAQVNFKQQTEDHERIKIHSIGYSVMGNLAEVKVILQKGEETIEGVAKGTYSRNNLLRLVGYASLDCIHTLLGIRDTFIVEEIAEIQLAKKDVIIVGIHFITSRGEELLVGSAFVKKDHYEAIVKATLDAVNRVIIQINE